MELHLFNMNSKNFIKDLASLSVGKRDEESREALFSTSSCWQIQKKTLAKATQISKSYSGKVMAVCISYESPIGVDIESKRRRSPETMKYFMDKYTTFKIKNRPDSYDEEWFYKAWTGMESYFKLVGGGFSADKNFALDLEKKCIYREGKKVAWIEHFTVDDFVICLCCNQGFSKDKIKFYTHGWETML